MTRPFSDDELERYERHIILPEIGGSGQQKLKQARVLVLGAGGLAAPVLHYLAAAGVGNIGIIDDDHVSLSNLQRQVIHGMADLGALKVESARDAIAGINPHVNVEIFPIRLDASNAPEIVKGYDLAVDGSDNFAARYVLSDACFEAKIPLITAAVGRFDGSLTVLKPYEIAADGKPNPSYRDLFPVQPPEGLVPSCSEAGIVGALVGVMGTLEAMEAIKLIVGIGEPLVGRLLLYDGLSARFETVTYQSKR